MELRGRRVLEHGGSLWYSTSMRIYMNIPFHVPLDVPRDELADMMRKERMLGVRYPSLHRHGLPSGIYVRRQKNYDLSSVHRKPRPRVRRSLEQCEVREVEEKELLVDGLQCNLDTMTRQNRFDREFGEPREWKRLVRATQKCPGVKVMGAFVDKRLAGYVITCREDGWLQLLHQMSRRDALDHFPNHALTYTLTKAAAEDPELEGVCYGLVGLSSGEGLHEYKLRMGYELEPQNSVFSVHPAVENLFSSSLVFNGIRLLRRARPHNERLERMESVFAGARIARFGPGAASHTPTFQSDNPSHA
jgi:hypothetical protein